MAEYIDRDKIFPNKIFFASAENPLKSLDELIKRIWSIPAADVVEVVRCGDCIHRVEENVCLHPKKVGGDTLVIEVKPDDFCSYGERRSE